ncbi:MAG: hypothetical protein Q9216_002474 [Gyalolechia sp. 2 TL-2023]
MACRLGITTPKTTMTNRCMAMTAPRAAARIPRVLIPHRQAGSCFHSAWRTARRGKHLQFSQSLRELMVPLAYSSEASSDIATRLEALESAENLHWLFGLLGLIGGTYGAYYWVHAETMMEASKRDQHDHVVRKQLNDLKILTSDLQIELQKANPQFQPGATQLAQKALESELGHAVWKSQQPLLAADINSEDPVERMAAKFRDPKYKAALKAVWDKTPESEQVEARKMVQCFMGVYGVKWPEEGNPFDN